jgi:hypothetical protein
MQFMVIRRANQITESGALPPALEPGVYLKPSAGGARLMRRNGEWSQEEGPFPTRELVAGLTLIEATSREDAIRQVRNWPTADSGAVFELRAAGCPGGCVGFDERGTAAGTVPQRNPDLKRYVVMIKSDENSEIDRQPLPSFIDAMNRKNEADVQAGVLLAGEGLRSTALGVRVHFSHAHSTVVDGPFTEVKELIAGYWLLQAANRQEAIEWARNYPYPGNNDLTLELREVCEPDLYRFFSTAMRAAEERMRAEQLEAGLLDAFDKAAGG